jgi:hypothetical protein
MATRCAGHRRSRSPPRPAPDRRRTSPPWPCAPGRRPRPRPGRPVTPARPAGQQSRAGRSPGRPRSAPAPSPPGPAAPRCRAPAHQPAAAAGRSHPGCLPSAYMAVASSPSPQPAATGRPDCVILPTPGSAGHHMNCTSRRRHFTPHHLYQHLRRPAPVDPGPWPGPPFRPRVLAPGRCLLGPARQRPGARSALTSTIGIPDAAARPPRLIRPVVTATIPARRRTSSGLPCRSSRRAPHSACPPSP